MPDWWKYTGKQTRVGPDGTETATQLDAAGRVESVLRRRVDNGGVLLRAEYSYYANGQLRRVEFGNDAAIEYTYDAAGRITAINHLNAAGQIMLRLSYGYDPYDVRGLPIMITEEQDTLAGTVTTAVTTFEYDGLGRLKHETRVGDPASSYDLAYTHDAGGNRLSTIDEVNHVETVYHHDVEDEPEYVYDSFNNRLMYFETFDTSGAEAELVSTTYYFYNDYGNVTRKVTELADPEPSEKKYCSTYLKYATNGQAVTYLVGEEWTYPESDYAVTFAREFWYDGARQRFLNREYDPVEMTSGNMVVESETWSDYVGDSIYADFTLNGSTVTVARIHEPGIGKMETPFDVPESAYYHADHIGTTRLLGWSDFFEPRDPAVYTAFGSLVSGTNHRYGYAGKHGYQSHADTPFLHVGARYYDPDTGRFLQRDPIGINGGLNVYAYVRNCPGLLVDPMGLWSLFRWAYTGDGNAPDFIYDDAVDAAARHITSGKQPAYAKALAASGGLAGGAAARRYGQHAAWAVTSCATAYGVWRLNGGSTGYNAIDESLDWFAIGVGTGANGIPGGGKEKPLLWEIWGL